MDLEGCKADQLVDIQSKLSLIQLKDSDRALWASFHKFSCAGTWKEIWSKGQFVPWCKLIWFNATFLEIPSLAG